MFYFGSYHFYLLISYIKLDIDNGQVKNKNSNAEPSNCILFMLNYIWDMFKMYQIIYSKFINFLTNMFIIIIDFSFSFQSILHISQCFLHLFSHSIQYRALPPSFLFFPILFYHLILILWYFLLHLLTLYSLAFWWFWSCSLLIVSSLQLIFTHVNTADKPLVINFIYWSHLWTFAFHMIWDWTS